MKPNSVIKHYISRTNATAYDITRSQDSIRAWAESVRECDLLRGILVKDISIISGTSKVVNHGLGRIPQGWLVVDLVSAGVPIVTRTSMTKTTITLDSTADATVSLWVF